MHVFGTQCRSILCQSWLNCGWLISDAWFAGGTMSLDGFEMSCDAYSSTLDRHAPSPTDDDDDIDSDSPSPSASMSVMRDSFISNDSPSAVLSPLNNFFFFDSLATSSSGGSNQVAAGILHPPLQPVTYWNDRRLQSWKWRNVCYWCCCQRVVMVIRMLVRWEGPAC